MRRRHINVVGLSDNYSITEDGKVFSHIKNRELKGSINSSGYHYYYLKDYAGDARWYFAHRLVYVTYVGKILHEINHKDRDKTNNHYSNLEDITHRENIRKARAIKPWVSSRPKGWPQSEETKKKIGAANGHPIEIFYPDGVCITRPSLGKAAEFLGVSYATVQRALKRGVYHTFPKGEFRLRKLM